MDAFFAVWETPLHLAAEQNHVDVAELLIRCGADVNAAEDVSTDPTRFTNLHYYAEAP